MTSQAHLPSGNYHNIVVALGANQPSPFGSPDKTILWACDALSQRVGGFLQKSSFYQTPAFPAGAGPNFVNAVVAIRTQLSPAAVLAFCHDIEAEAGRRRDVRWDPRTLDIDLIAYGDVVLPDREVHDEWRDMQVETQQMRTPDQLILPHPRAQDRSFVLVPMMDVAPDWRHPILGLTTRQMLHARPADEKASVCLLDVV